MSDSGKDRGLLADVWATLAGPTNALDAVSLVGPRGLLPSVYEVVALATASVAAATLAVAEVQSVRSGAPLREIRIDRRHAAAAFRSERYLSPIGWSLPPVWDPLAGDYRTRDGWIRLHTNYAYHRNAVVRVVGGPAARDSVEKAVADWKGDELETAVVEAGGCAAMLRAPHEWAEHPQGRAVATEPVFAIESRVARVPALDSDRIEQAPLAGVRVLDLTRVIAGPVCTRFLAAYGADVLRIDPPGFEEVGALLSETTVGKRRAFLDLAKSGDRKTFEELVAGAHIIVHGYRSDALAKLGFGSDRLRALNPDLVIVCHDAYGWTGPWSRRRGFDSLVQMSCGIAWRGREVAAAGARPFPLPAQALDHGTGYLLAAAACRSLCRLVVDSLATEVRLSLARTAQVLMDLGDTGNLQGADFSAADAEPWLEDGQTAFGRVRRVRCPGEIEGVAARWNHLAGPLGSDPPAW